MCSAFATLLRRIVFDIDQGDEHWLNSLAKAGFTQEDITHIYDFVKQNFFDNVDSGSSDFTRNNVVFDLTQQWYTNTWTSQEFIPNATCTTTGSAAGTTFANLLHSLAMSRVLETVRRSLHNEGLATSLKVPDTGNVIPLDDASFVDDMALPIACPANILTSHIADVCGIVFVAFRM